MGKDEETKFKRPELLDHILEEKRELIKILAASIKTAENRPHLGVVECSALDVWFLFDVGCSMFDVHLSKQLSAYGT